MNVPRRVNLFTGGRIALDPGGVAVVSQSGFLVRSALSAGRERRLGFSVAVSSGNEAVCELADYVEALAADDDTRVICLVIEKVHDPERFFAAVGRAHAAGKAILALKLGRTERSRDILRSHTGAIADESWVYDLVLGQLGVQTARDIDELLDMAQLLAQLPPEDWRPVRGVAVVASSGGVAGVAADVAEDAGIVLPPVEELADWVAATRPGRGQPQPPRHDRVRDARPGPARGAVRPVRHRAQHRRAGAVLVGGRGRRGMEPGAPRAASQGGGAGVGADHRLAGRGHRRRVVDGGVLGAGVLPRPHLHLPGPAGARRGRHRAAGPVRHRAARRRRRSPPRADRLDAAVRRRHGPARRRGPLRGSLHDPRGGNRRRPAPPAPRRRARREAGRRPPPHRARRRAGRRGAPRTSPPRCGTSAASPPSTASPAPSPCSAWCGGTAKRSSASRPGPISGRSPSSAAAGCSSS